MDKSNLIKEKLHNIGFDLVGFTRPVIQDHHLVHIKRRIKDNDLPYFMHPDTDKLISPKSLDPWAETIISLALSYATSVQDQADGYISNYARGKDYHRVMKNKILEGISSIKEEFNDFRSEYYIDNAPILEKVIASQAGLGWIGKNTTLINKKYGSYLFLGEIFINKKLKYDDPGKNLCKDCSLCIENCPTDSLNISYYLNYNSCRSSLTQLKGVLNNDQEKLIGNSIWGCDHCQEVCPYNHNSIKDIHSEFKPILRGDIIDILNYKREDLPIKWQESALSWRGMRIIHRNALIVLINMVGDGKKYKKVIEEKFKDSSPIIRYYAYKAYLSFDYDQSEVKKIINNDQELKNTLKDGKWLDGKGKL